MASFLWLNHLFLLLYPSPLCISIGIFPYARSVLIVESGIVNTLLLMKCESKLYTTQRSNQPLKLQILIVWSSLPETILSSPRARQLTAAWWPTRVAVQLPSSLAQTCNDLSVTSALPIDQKLYLDCPIMTSAHQPHLVAGHSPNTFNMTEVRPSSLTRFDVP